MTLQLKLPTEFTDPDLPVFSIDPVLPAAGALYLFDFAHPANPAGSNVGIPATNGKVPNLAGTQARALLGGSLADYDGTWNVGAKANTGGIAKLERTGKGGVHMITTQTGDADTAYARVDVFPSAIATRLGTDDGRNYYFSTWGRTTRGMLDIGAGFSASVLEAYGPDGPPTGHYRAYMFFGRNQAEGPGRPVPTSAVGPWHANAASNDFVGTQSNPAGLALIPINLGTAGVYAFTAEMRSKEPSRVIYRAYCEDLTASGRTYEEVDALDQAQYVADVLTEGGRYYGDTFTAPSTIP